MVMTKGTKRTKITTRGLMAEHRTPFMFLSSVSFAPLASFVSFVFLVFFVFFVVPPAAAQQLLDRVLVRVNGDAITQTDVQAAIALGIVDVMPGENAQESALQQMIDRQMLLQEIARFPPPEPTQAAVDQEVQRLTQHATMPLDQLARTTGVDGERIRDIARDSLRIRSYLQQRFGSSGQVTDQEVRDYYEAHMDAFRRNGATIPFEDAEPAARERAAADRRNSTIQQWMRELRARADVATPADESR
jgi:hypothetical protein